MAKLADWRNIKNRSHTLATLQFRPPRPRCRSCRQRVRLHDWSWPYITSAGRLGLRGACGECGARLTVFVEAPKPDFEDLPARTWELPDVLLLGAALVAGHRAGAAALKRSRRERADAMSRAAGLGLSHREISDIFRCGLWTVRRSLGQARAREKAALPGKRSNRKPKTNL